MIVEQDSNQCRLARAVGTQQSEHLSRLDLKGDAAKSRGVSVTLVDVLKR